MPESPAGGLADIKMDANNLYREEVFTDLKVGTLRRMTPVKSDGSPDPDRAVLYSAETQLMSQAGPLPVSGGIEATSLKEAAEQFPVAIQAAVEQMMEEAREMQRRESSRIITAGPSSLPPGSGLIR